MSPILFWSYFFARIIGFTIHQNELPVKYEQSIYLVADFQTEIGCSSDWEASCATTEFKQVGNLYRLNLRIPAGTWNFKILDKDVYYGRNHIKDGSAWTIRLESASNFLFEYSSTDHKLNFQIAGVQLESRSMPPLPTISLTDTLIFDPNGNMVANPGDSIRYTIILRNETGQSVLNAVITHTGDPNVTYDPSSLKASPLAFNDTLQFLINPLILSVPGILTNDFDLNDPLPNPPFYSNLFVHRVESNQASVGNTITTAAGGMIMLNMDGSLTYDSTGVNGAVEDSIHYTIKDADGYEDSAIIFIQFNLPPAISSNLVATDTICAFEQRDTFVMTTVFTLMDDELNSESAKIVICNSYLASEDTLIAGTLPGGITAMWTEGTGTLMLMGTASLADYETAIESIQYINQSDNANTAIRTICITVYDGVLNSNTVTRLLKVKPVNDCPTAVRDSISILENTLVPVFSVLTNDTDPDLDVLSVSKINNAMTLSGVVINGGAVGLDAMTGNLSFMHTTGFGGLDSLSEGEMFIARFGYSVSDGLCEASDSVIIKITGVNDAPLIATNLMATDSICAFEQSDTFLVTSAFTILDDEDNTDSAKISICLNYLASEDTLIVPALPGGITFTWDETTGTGMLMGSATKADYETAIESIQYTNQNNTPDMTPRRICITVHDGSLLSNQVTRELKIKPVNDCPVAVRDSISIFENDDIAAFNVLTNDQDVDMNTLSVTKINNAMSLSMVNIHGGSVTINGVTGNMSFTQTTGFTGLDSLSEGEMFFVRFSYTASDLQCEDADSVIIKITGVNDAPLIASNLMTTDSICAFEQQDTFLMTSAFTIQDDEANTDSAKISICNNYLSSEDTLIVPALPGGITFSWNETTGTLMLMGSATKANYEAAIESIQYTNQSNTPNLASRRICITLHDGDLLSNQVPRELKIKPVNDCPTAVRDTFLVNENASFPTSNVLTNDTDPEMDILMVTPAMNVVSGGTASVFGAGGFSFAHTTGPMGLDTLNVGEMFFARSGYTITDGACMDSDSVIIKITGVNDAPVADSNSYVVSQTSVLSVGAPGLLADDDDIDHNATIMVAAVKGLPGNVGTLITLPSGAELTVNANGSFTYNPKCLAAGLDTFSYQIKDEHNLFSDTAIVYINVDQNMWFVDDNAGTMGTGSFSNPFDQLSDAEAASAIGEYIFVFPGTYGQSITLKNSQKLIGADENWNCPSGSTIRTASGTSTITGTITLAQNDTIKGIEMGNSTAGMPMLQDNGTSVLNLLISNTNLNTSTSSGLRIANGGALNVTIDAFNSTSPAEAIFINNSTGNLIVSSGTINPSTGGGDTMVTIKGSTLSAIINASISQPNNFPLSFIGAGHMTGTVTFQTGTLSASNGSGLQFDNADGIYNFNGQVTLSGGDAGVDIINGSGGNFSFLNTDIINPNGVAFLVNGGGGSIGHSGTLTKNSSGKLIDIQSRTGGSVTFNDPLTSTSPSTGITVSNNTGGTVTFGGNAKTLSTGTNTAITIASNSNTTVNFTNGGLDIDVTSGTGFSATSNSGTGIISVQGSGNTINSTTGTALNVVSSTIGGSDLNFQSISKNGGVNGIILNTTGTSGGLVVTGTGAANSGGTIQNTTGDAILATSTQDLSLTRMLILSPAGDGINASDLGGTCLLSNSTIQDYDVNRTATKDGYRIINTSTTLTSLTITGCTFNGTTSDLINPGSGDGVFMEAQGSGNMTLIVNGNTSFTEMFDDGIQVNGITGATATVNVTVQNCSFINAAVLGNGGVGLFPFGGINMTALIDTNTFDNIMFPVTNLGAVSMTNGLTANATITVQNNTMNNLVGSRGITITADGTSSNTLVFDNNTIDSLGSSTKSAISVNCLNTATANVKIRNNLIGQGGTLYPSAVSALADVVLITSQNSAVINVLLSGNTITANTGFEVMRTRAINSSTINATVTGNNLNDNAGVHVEFEAVTGSGAVVGGTVCLNISGNVVPAAGVGVIRITENAAPGAINVTQSSSATVSTGNSNATVTLTGAPLFGQPTCTMPLLFARGGIDKKIIITKEMPLNQKALDSRVGIAIQLWETTGITKEQIAILNNLEFKVDDLRTLHLGETDGQNILLDKNANENGWYIGQDDDSKLFNRLISVTRSYTTEETEAAGRVDLLTTILHEMGHSLGLTDTYDLKDRDNIMYGYLSNGERRIPAVIDAATSKSLVK
ncbi:MAG: Ig-like domain-containing protein [Saprospiraceae bacterium]|nr:Ig-like domain-containing protein [Saprospiraceae bacterium]